jgi:arylsulfatase A-like enzyme
MIGVDDLRPGKLSSSLIQSNSSPVNQKLLVPMGKISSVRYTPNLKTAYYYSLIFVHFTDTPNLVRLAKRGTTFTRAYCQVPLCSPSRTSLLTGLRPDTSKVWTIGPYFRDVMDKSHAGSGQAVITLPEFFKQQGYNTTGSVTPHVSTCPNF